LRSTSGTRSMSSGVENVTELLAGLPDRRRVDDRQHLRRVLDQHAIEQGFVEVLQRRQPDVLLQGRPLRPQVFQFELHLLLDRQHAPGQQPAEAESFALFGREGPPLVQQRVAQQLAAAQPHAQALAGFPVVRR